MALAWKRLFVDRCWLDVDTINLAALLPFVTHLLQSWNFNTVGCPWPRPTPATQSQFPPTSVGSAGSTSRRTSPATYMYLLSPMLVRVVTLPHTAAEPFCPPIYTHAHSVLVHMSIGDVWFSLQLGRHQCKCLHGHLRICLVRQE